MLGLALERAGSEFSDATLATGAGNTIWSNNDRKKGLHADISLPTDFSGQSFFGSRNSESYFGWLAEHKFERNNEFAGYKYCELIEFPLQLLYITICLLLSVINSLQDLS